MEIPIIPPVGDEMIALAEKAAKKQSASLGTKETLLLTGRIKDLLKKQDAVLVSHYYTSPELQQLAEETGGCVADSLEMARFGRDHSATTLIVAGVRFMGETAKILNPEKRVLMPDLKATCSLDLNCPTDLFTAFCDDHPEYTSVVYANTSAAVKARADWVVTSGIALPIIKHLAERGEKVLWAPDRHLGSYVQELTGVEMLIWPGTCIVHDKFKAEGIVNLQKRYPDAKILVHPESPAEIIRLADVVGSTTALIDAAVTLDAREFIVATEPGIFYKMKQATQDKVFIEAPTAGEGATCESCSRCPWMGMNGLQNLAQVLETGRNEIEVDEAIRKKAMVSLKRMMDFALAYKAGPQSAEHE